MGTPSWVALSKSAPSNLLWREGGGDAWRREGKANPTHNSGPTPSLKELSPGGSCAHPSLTYPFCVRAPSGCPQALNAQHCQ